MTQLEIEREALRKETDKRLEGAAGEDREGDRRPARSSRCGMKAHWQQEKAAIQKIRATKEQIEQARFQIDEVTAQGRPRQGGRAALRHAARAREAARGRERQAGAAAVDAADAEGRSRRGGRRGGRRASGPASPSRGCSRARCRSCCTMEERLRERVVGQDEALLLVANAVRRARAGLGDPRPADRLVPVPGPDRRRQDRARAGAGRVPVRRRARDGSPRHVASTWRSTPWRG